MVLPANRFPPFILRGKSQLVSRPYQTAALIYPPISMLLHFIPLRLFHLGSSFHFILEKSAVQLTFSNLQSYRTRLGSENGPGSS